MKLDFNLDIETIPAYFRVVIMSLKGKNYAAFRISLQKV